jgi:hypothetical protein
MGKYKENCLSPDYPSSLDLIRSPLLQLIAQELGQTVVSLRKQLSDELKLEFEQSRTNLEALYEKSKTKDADTYTWAIESEDWVLGHQEIDCLAIISNLEIVIHPEEYGSPTRCKMMHIYNKAAPRGNITIFRTVEGSVAKVSDTIQEEVELIYPTAMLARPSSYTMAVTRSNVYEGGAELTVPPELAPKGSENTIGREPYNSTESVPLTEGISSVERAVADGSSFGRYKLVATDEVLADGEFQAVAKVTQDSTTDGFVDLSPEDTLHIVTAMMEGMAAPSSGIAAYNEQKGRTTQQQSYELRKAISIIENEGLVSLKQELEAQKQKVLSMDLQTLLKHIDSVTIHNGILCLGGNANQPQMVLDRKGND